SEKASTDLPRMSVSETYTMAPAANARPKASMRAFGALVVNTSSPPRPVARPARVVTIRANRTSGVKISDMPGQFGDTGATPTMAAAATRACYPNTARPRQPPSFCRSASQARSRVTLIRAAWLRPERDNRKPCREPGFTRLRAHGALVWFACRGEGPDAHLSNGTDCRRFVPPHPQRR